MAACVGRICGLAPEVAHSKTTMQSIRYPYAAEYNCAEGFSTTGDAAAPKVFSMQCGTDGNFEKAASHKCNIIECGHLPEEKNAEVEEGEFVFQETGTYTCAEGHTTDETASGHKTYTRTCQATGRFTDGEGCRPVRCGPAPVADNAFLEESNKVVEKVYGDKVTYKCDEGHSLDQKPLGTKEFTLVCTADGGFAPEGDKVDGQLPKCRPVNAGPAPLIPHGRYNSPGRDMFFGESAMVTAETGYSTLGSPVQGLSFTMSVSAMAEYDGIEKLIPVICGDAPAVLKAKTPFSGKASYGDVLSYDCDDGYSLDGSNREG